MPLSGVKDMRINPHNTVSRSGIITYLKAHALIFFILIIAILLRSQEIWSGNYLFLIDQGRDMLAVKKIVFDHDLTLIGPYTSLGGVFQGPFYYYLLAFPTFLTNGDPIGAMYAMAVISLLTIAAAYYLCGTLFGKDAALFTSFLFVASPEAAAAATYIWNPHPMWLLITLYCFLLYLARYKNRRYHLALWPVIFLMFHFQMAFGVFLFMATFLYFLAFGRKHIAKRQVIRAAIISSAVLLPQILFEIRNDFLMTRSVFTVLSGGSHQGLFTGNEFSGYLPLIQSHASSFLDNFRSSFPHMPPLTYFPPAIAVISVITLAFLKNRMEKQHLSMVYLLGLIILVILCIGFVYPFPIRYWFLTGFQSFYLIIAGIVLATLWRYRTTRIIPVITVLICLWYAYNRIVGLYSLPEDEGGLAKIKGKLAAIDYVYADAKEKEFGLLVFTPPVNTDAYDYLVWWRARNKYHYTPHTEKRGMVYLLIEPDPHQPWTYNGWLETVIVDGEISDTATLPGGAIIQKRYFTVDK